MDLIPHEELRPAQGFNFAPMIDFLFLMLSLFATLAISRTALYDTDIQLAEVKPTQGAKLIKTSRDIQQINLSVSSQGSYKWVTEFQEHPMANIHEIQNELNRQYQIGALSQDKTKTEVLLHIDKNAPWKTIADLIFAVKELGFNAHPVYENVADKPAIP
ncbi:MAG TPA: biopolymer transporter ExbD [Chlamydiales bacterium]|nr:biopolymer transporter ExbD [Chlamydiales bacterium]